MSGLPFLWANYFYQNFKKLPKKLEDLGSNGQKFDFRRLKPMSIQTNVLTLWSWWVGVGLG